MIGNQPLNRAHLNPQRTSLSVGQTLINCSYTPGYQFVFLDGVLLTENVDYTTNITGTAITLTSPALAGQTALVQAFGTFESGNFHQKTEAHRKNWVVNGCHRNNSEGSASYTAGGYDLDQNYSGWTSGTSGTITQYAFEVGAEAEKGHAADLVAITGYYNTRIVEGVDSLAGKKVTLAFNRRLISGSKVRTKVYIRQYFGTGGSPSPSNDTLTQDFDVASDGRVELTFDLDSIAGKTIGTDGNDYLAIIMHTDTGAITGKDVIYNVGLYEGDTAPMWEPEDQAVLDAQCARFYWNPKVLEWMYLFTSSGTQIQRWTIHHPVPMRATPTTTVTYDSGVGTLGSVVSQNPEGTMYSYTGAENAYIGFFYKANARL